MVVSPDFLRDSTDMARDQLSDVFNLIEVRGLVSGGFSVRGDWKSRFKINYPLKLVAMVWNSPRTSAGAFGFGSSVSRLTLSRRSPAAYNSSA